MTKKVFITGGSTGIGEALAKKYLKMDYIVGVCGRTEEKFKENFKNELEGQKIFFYQVDVVDKEKLQQAIKDFSQGKLDLLICNAGVSLADKKKIPDWNRGEKLININIHGVFYAFETGVELMSNTNGGQIVVISSVAGMLGLPGSAHYCASKAALVAFCESMSINLNHLNIKVSCIAPGFIKTPLTDKNRHPMPFIISATKGADLIYRAIEQKKELYLFPWPMKILIIYLSSMPRSLYRSLMKLIFK